MQKRLLIILISIAAIVAVAIPLGILLWPKNGASNGTDGTDDGNDGGGNDGDG